MIGSHNTGTFTPETLRKAIITSTRKGKCVYVAGIQSLDNRRRNNHDWIT